MTWHYKYTWHYFIGPTLHTWEADVSLNIHISTALMEGLLSK